MLAKQRHPKSFPKPTRVLIIHTKYAESGGESSVVQNELNLLKAHGCDIAELYFNNKNFAALNALLMPFNIFSFFRVLKTCLKYRPALVHIHNTHFAASPSIIWAIKLLNIPIVKTLHNYRLLCPSGTLFSDGNLYLKSLNKSFPWKAVKEKIYRNSLFLTFWLAFSTWLHKIAGTWKKVNKYIVFSEQGRQLFLDAGFGLRKEQFIIKPNFTQISLRSPVKRNGGFLYVGRLSEEKGIKILLDAFSANGLALVIIGDGPCSMDVEKAMTKNPLITWLGFQDKEVVSAALQKCSALIFPSICYEGMPVSIIEAFACGTPVIASKLGAMERMVQHNLNGILFKAGDAGDLNEHLAHWNDLTRIARNSFYKNAIKTYTDIYTPAKNLEMLLSVYESAINGSHHKSNKIVSRKIRRQTEKV